MKLPFVSRGRFEDALTDAQDWATAHTEMERQATYANQAAQELRSMLTDLTAKYDHLVKKVMDQHIPEPPEMPVYEAQEPELHADILRAIAARSEPGSTAYSHLINQALQMSQFGDQPTDIADAIFKGDEAPV